MGGAGSDTLIGGAGNDDCRRRRGNDVFRFLAGFGKDTITDFTARPVGSNKDLLDISGLGITAGTSFDGSVKIVAAGTSTMISIGTDTIRLTGVVAANINSSNFVLAS